MYCKIRWGCLFYKCGKAVILPGLLCLLYILSPVLLVAQYAFLNDQIKTYTSAPQDSIISSVICTDEVNRYVAVTSQFDKSSRLPFITVTIFNDDFSILSQTAITDASNTIPKNGQWIIYDIKRIQKGTSDCGSGYILAGMVKVKDQKAGILMLIDSLGKYLNSKYYPALSECRAVEVAKGGYIAVGDSIIPGKDVAKIFKTDCNLNVKWCQQFCNYTGDAYCYAQYTNGSTDLIAIKSIAKGKYAIAGTAQWMITTSRIGDQNIVLGAIDDSGTLLWGYTYGYAGTGTRYEESVIDISIDTFDTKKNQIVVIGSSAYDTSSACSADTIPALRSNLLFATDFSGNVFWAREIPYKEGTSQQRLFSDVASSGGAIAVAGQVALTGILYGTPAIYRFDRQGAFLEDRIYDDGSGGYRLPSVSKGSSIANDRYSNSGIIGKLNSGEIYTIQSYPTITSSCDMTKETVSVHTRAMPSIGLSLKSLSAIGISIKLANSKDLWTAKDHCKKSKK